MAPLCTIPTVLFLFILFGIEHPVLVQAARKCGTTLTKECKSSSDKRYNPSYGTSLKDQALAWERLGGLYSGVYHEYDAFTFERILTSELVQDFTGTNEYRLSPSRFFVNLTIAGTRAFRQTYTIQQGRFNGDRPGRTIFCDSWSVGTWEKDGIARNFKTNCTNANDGEIPLLEGSNAYPVDDYGLVFLEKFRIDENNENSRGLHEVVYTLTCTLVLKDECQKISFVHERFWEGFRTVYLVGDLTKVGKEEFTQLISDAYVEYTITERDQVLQPMRRDCLIASLYDDPRPCISDREFCQEGDPACTKSPYQEPDGALKPGVIAAFVCAAVAVTLALSFVLMIVLSKAQVKRARQFFAMRMAETMGKTDKSVLEFTPEEILKEFKRLEEHVNGELNQENFYNFLSAGPTGYMDYWDFVALWRAINVKMTGTMDFLEFCSIMAHCHQELTQSSLDLLQRAEQEGNEDAQVEQQNLVNAADSQ